MKQQIKIESVAKTASTLLQEVKPDQATGEAKLKPEDKALLEKWAQDVLDSKPAEVLFQVGIDAQHVYTHADTVNLGRKTYADIAKKLTSKVGLKNHPSPAERPLKVHVHDEAIYRCKDQGRYGWGKRGTASQRFKDDGSGRMLSGFFEATEGVLWFTEDIVKTANNKRARDNEPSIEFGKICSLFG